MLLAAEACAAEADALGFDWTVVFSRVVSCSTSATVAGSPEVKAVDERRVESVSTSSVDAASEEPLEISAWACDAARLPRFCAAVDETDTFVLCRDVFAAAIADSVVEKISCAEEAFCSTADEACADDRNQRLILEITI